MRRACATNPALTVTADKMNRERTQANARGDIRSCRTAANSHSRLEQAVAAGSAADHPEALEADRARRGDGDGARSAYAVGHAATLYVGNDVAVRDQAKSHGD